MTGKLDQPKAGVRLRNHGRGHSYTIDGEKVPGVTSLIRDGLPKSVLIGWAARMTAGHAIDYWDELVDLTLSQRYERLVKVHREITRSAGERGTKVHGLAERLAAGEEVHVPDDLAGHVESCVRFLDQFKPVPVLSEFVVGSRTWSYGGRGDAIMDFPAGVLPRLDGWPDLSGGGRAYVDYKTSNSGIWGETGLQSAAYVNADVVVVDGPDGGTVEKPLADFGIQAGFAVWLRGDGFDLYPVDVSPEAFKLFLHVATVARAAPTLRDDLVGPAILPPHLTDNDDSTDDTDDSDGSDW